MTKAQLVQEGYPKSGFTYDTFIDNAGMMTTDSDKRTYKLYELQDRISSTIRLFENVKDAKVTIALGEESKYALDDEAKQDSSATAVVTMKDGGSPTEDQAAAIQRLVAKSVPGMELDQVAVFDGNGNDVSVSEESSSMNGSDAEEIAAVIENQIEEKVHDVLGPVYGNQNVRISARAKVDMQRLIRESTTYNTPEKIDPNDKSGIVSHEESMTENTKNGRGTAGGEVGTETNADNTEYAAGGGGNSSAGSESESVSKDYLVNQIKEQGQIDPGVLTDLTVAVAINGEGYGELTDKKIRDLVGNAAGIAAEDREGKISLVSAPFYKGNTEASAKRMPMDTKTLDSCGNRSGCTADIDHYHSDRCKRRKKKRMLEEQELLAAETEVMPDLYADSDEDIERLSKEMQELRNDRGMELKKQVREFADQNPEISAQLLKSWLNGGEDHGEQ